jgi:hypothetical protein
MPPRPRPLPPRVPAPAGEALAIAGASHVVLGMGERHASMVDDATCSSVQ